MNYLQSRFHLQSVAIQAIDMLNKARELLERTTDNELQDAADDIGPVLLAIEDWQRKHNLTPATK